MLICESPSTLQSSPYLAIALDVRSSVIVFSFVYIYIYIYIYVYMYIDRQTTLKRHWKPFIIIWTTWYNLRKCAVEHACKFSAIHVKNTYQICNCFLHECLASFLKQDGVKFRQWSAITRKLSYPLWSDGNRTLSFYFSGHWLAPKTFYCYLNKLNLTCTTAIYLLRACAVDTKMIKMKTCWWPVSNSKHWTRQTEMYTTCNHDLLFITFCIAVFWTFSSVTYL